MAGTDNGTQRIQSTERSFAILEALKELDGARVTELATHLDVPPSTVHVHLKTLKEIGYVVKEGDFYQVGLRFAELSEYARKRHAVYQLMDDVTEDLAEETGERAQFAVEENGYCIFVNRAGGKHGINTPTAIGSRSPLHQTAVGKAILASLPRRRVEEIVERRGLPAATDATITTADELFETLAAIRDRGYAVNDEELISGVRALGVPVRGPSGQTAGALGLAGPAHRFSGQRFEEDLPKLMLGTVNEIELNLKYSE